MKKATFHALFWLSYISVCTFIEFLWEKATIPDYSTIERLISSIKVTSLEVLPQLLFGYYVSYYGLNKFVVNKRSIVPAIAQLSIMLFACILAERILNSYFIVPYLYKNRIPNAPLLELRRLFVVFLYMMFASGLMVAIRSVRMQLAAKEREKNLIKEKLEAELRFLRNQVNPHFLFNTLNNIYGLARKRSDKTPEVIMKLSELLSFMLYESGKESVTISEEINMLKDYLTLEKIRYNDRLSIEFEQEVDNITQPISPLLLLPLVENAFKHGVSETRFDSFVKIKMKLRDASLCFCVENSVEQSNITSRVEQIGLGNLSRQLELMYKEHSFELVADNNIFKATVNVNLNSYGKN